MSEFVIPAANWSDELSRALREAVRGDTVIVRTEPMLRLAEIAAQRMGKTGVSLVIADALDDDGEPVMTGAEHLQWAKERALAYADQGAMATAITSLRSDLGKHPDTAASVGIIDELMVPLMLTGGFDRPGELRKFIEGFN